MKERTPPHLRVENEAFSRPCPECDDLQKMKLEFLDFAESHLPPHERRLYEDYFLMELSMPQISAKYGIPLGTTRRFLDRIRLKMKRCFLLCMTDREECISLLKSANTNIATISYVLNITTHGATAAHP